MVRALVEPVVEVETEKIPLFEVVAMLLIKLAGKDRARFWTEMEALNRLPEVVVETPWTTLLLSLPAARVPVKPKVRALALMLPVMLVSLVTLVTTLAPRLMEVEVPIKTFWPPVMERLEPTVREAKVLVPVPPLAAPRIEVTLPPERLMALAVICWPVRER